MINVEMVNNVKAIEARHTQTAKFLRKIQVLVGHDGNGDVSPATGVSIENLRISFEIQKTIYRTPNQAKIQVYNLHPDREKQCLKEFNDVIVNAGYEGQQRCIFRGNIKYTYSYREGNDRITQIFAADGDKDFNGALVNFSLGAGHDDEKAVKGVLESFRATTMGHVHGKHLKRERVRGKVYTGNARDIMDQIARENDGHWSIQDGLLMLVPVDSVLPTEAVVIDADNGLLGAPEVNDKGITIKTMLDGRIIPGSKLWLRNNEVRMKTLKAEQTGQQRKLKGPNPPVRVDPDGVYKVYAVKLTGDNYSTEASVCECKCVGLNQPIPSSKGMPQSSTPDADVL